MIAITDKMRTRVRNQNRMCEVKYTLFAIVERLNILTCVKVHDRARAGPG